MIACGKRLEHPRDDPGRQAGQQHRPSDLRPGQRQYAEGLRSAGESLLSVINDILDFSKIEAGKLELGEVDFDPRHMVEDVVQLLAPTAHAKGLELAGVFPPALPLGFRGAPHGPARPPLGSLGRRRGRAHWRHRARWRPCAMGREAVQARQADGIRMTQAGPKEQVGSPERARRPEGASMLARTRAQERSYAPITTGSAPE